MSRSPRLAAYALAAAAVATATPLSPTSAPAAAVPVVSAAAFDPNSTGWYSYRDQTSAGFAATFKDLSKGRYLPVDLDIETAGGGYRVGSVWQTNSDGRAWRELRDLTSAGFSDAWNQAKEDGLRLVEQETYLIDGQRRYAGIWVENSEGYAWASHRGQTNAQFKASFAAHKAAGLMPVDYDEYATASGLRFNSVWVERGRSGWKLQRGLTSVGFSQKFAQNKGDYRMIGFDSLRHGAKQRYAGLWVSNDNGRGWLARRDMGVAAYKNYWYRYRDLGYRVVSFDRYETANGTRYAAIWRQNTERPAWSLKDQVDTLVQDELDDTGVPGISVAVYVGGQARYLRGFGHADLDAGEWMDSSHVGSIASVSKAVAGVLTMRMQEQGDLDLSDDTRDHVPTMPAHHTHTISDLVANRACVRHYGDVPSTGFANQPFGTALAASQEFWDDDLMCTPGAYYYSTHGYTLLGAALEAAGGDDVKDLIRTRLQGPFALGTLGPQDFSAAVHRMAIYTSGDDEVDTPNNDWKVLGGGLDSSAADLASFGAKLIDGQIIGDDSFTEMVTPPNGVHNYAHGWNTDTENGYDVVAKGGSWTGNLAYLRLYPELGISIACTTTPRAWCDVPPPPRPTTSRRTPS